MKKMTFTALIAVAVFSLILTAVKTKPAPPVPQKEESCKVTCPKQKPVEEKKSNSGLIFWDTYSSQLLQIQPVSF
jgi:hypothetical protein